MARVSLFIPEAETFHVTDLPRAVSEGVYERAIAEYLDRIGRSGDISDVFQIGSVTVPGVSDIDLLVVLRDDGAVRDPQAFSISGLSDDARYAFMHTPFIFNRISASGVHRHYRIDAIRHLLGETPAGEVFSEAVTSREAVRLAKASIALDFGVDLLTQFVRILATRRLQVRGVLCLLYSLRHTIDLATQVVGSPLPLTGSYQEDVLELRVSAVSMKPKVLVQETVRLLRAAVPLALSAVVGVAQAVLPMPAEGDRGIGVFRYGRKLYLRFDRLYQEDRALADVERLSRDVNVRWSPARLENRLVIPLPGSLYHHFAGYTSPTGIAADAVASRLFPRPAPPPTSAYGKALEQKVQMANQQAAFLRSQGLGIGQLFLNQFTGSSGRFGGVLGHFWELGTVARLRLGR